jgi:selenocysteine-specific elongation factor
VKEGNLIRLPEHRLRFSEEEARIRQALLRLFREAGFSPPDVEEALERVGGADRARSVLQAMVQIGELVDVGQGLLFHPEVLEAGKERIRQEFQRGGAFTVSQFRQWVGTSRKYAVPLLEYYDQIGFTRRVGNERVVRGEQA